MDQDSLQELDVVALTVDVPELGLTEGQVGTVVVKHSADAFEVEFVDNNGRTYAVATLRTSQVLRLQFAPAEAA